MNCEQIKEQIEAYALDALEERERREVEQHVARCDDCRQLLEEYREMLAHISEIAATGAPAGLDPAVKERLLASVEKSQTGAATTTKSADRRPHHTPGHRPQPRRRIWQLAALASAVLLLLILAWNIQLNVALARERALRAEVADIVGQQELVLEIVDSRQTSRLVLLPPSEDADAYGKVFTRADMPYVVAMAARLPPPPAGQAYHLWLTQGASTELAGVMTLDEQGFGLLIYQAAQDGPVYDAATLTLQPLGADRPAGEPSLIWSQGE